MIRWCFLVLLSGCSTYGPTIIMTNGRWNVNDNHVAVISFTLTNVGNRPAKDINMKCNFIGESGTIIETVDKTIYDSVPIGDQRNYNNFPIWNMPSQAKNIDCSPTHEEDG